MIALDRVAKSYDGGESFAVRDVSLVASEGEFVVLLGESGCGKTTTLKMINRLIAPSAGTIRVAGDDAADMDPVLLRRRIGYAFQEVGLFPHMSVAANAGAVLKLLGRSPLEIERRTHEVLEQVGLDPTLFGPRRPAELSGGEKQRVGVARALAARPRIMLMDEPFGALDPLTRAELQAQFRSLQRELSLTVVMVTHDMTEALVLADRIAIMNDGRVVASGTPAALLADPGHPYAARLLAAPRQQADQLGKLLGGSDS